MIQILDVYLATLAKMEPNLTSVDRDASLASIAISVKRIADSLAELLSIAKDELPLPEDSTR